MPCAMSVGRLRRDPLPASRSFVIRNQRRLSAEALSTDRHEAEAVMSGPTPVTNPDDKALMLEYQEHGDTSAFEQLFQRHRVPLFRYLRGLSRSAEIAEEASQHAWLKVIEAARASRFSSRTHSSFKTWLYTLARNHYIDHYLRAHASTRTISNSEELLCDERETSEAVDDTVDRGRLRCVLDRALKALPVEQLDVILLWVAGHELADIAQITGVPWDTALSRKKYALAKLRITLASVGVAKGDT